MLSGLRYLGDSDRIETVKIVDEELRVEELKRMAAGTFGNMVKAVVDVDREIVAVDGELPFDLEAMLLEDGSKQANLWGINLYPDLPADEFIEFDSLINIRPSQATSAGVWKMRRYGRRSYRSLPRGSSYELSA